MLRRSSLWMSPLLAIVAACGGDSVTAPVTPGPDPDPDNDGILSVVDSCPDEPETVNGVFDADGCPDTPADFYRFVRDDAEAYWDSVFTARQWPYAPIGQFTSYASPLDTPCGQIPINNAVYCVLDAGVYYHGPFMDALLSAIGDAAPAFVVAHEIGHHIGTGHLGWLGGVTVTTKESELGADCFAGAWLAWVDARGMLESGDAEELIETMITIGDPADTWFDPTEHGTPDQRAAAMLLGVAGGPWVCLPDPGTISGSVFDDANANGSWDSGEGVWQNVPVDVTTQWDEQLRVFTDANGQWTAEVPVGTAIVDIDESAFPAGVIRTFGSDPDTVLVATGLATFAGNDGFHQPPPALTQRMPVATGTAIPGDLRAIPNMPTRRNGG